jgi:hypothetical protein
MTTVHVPITRITDLEGNPACYNEERGQWCPAHEFVASSGANCGFGGALDFFDPRPTANCPVWSKTAVVLQSAAPVEVLPQCTEHWTVALDQDLVAGLVG